MAQEPRSQGNGIGAEGARALSALTGLTSLNLGGNGIGDEGARALAALTGLTSLNLQGNGIGTRGPGRCPPSPASPASISGATASGTEGARALSALTGLTSLNLWGNGIGDEGARALAALTGLTSLDLWEQRHRGRGGQGAVRPHRPHQPRSQGNGIGAEGARALAALTGLTSLNLWGNGIGDEGARALSALTGLTSLNLGDNGIGAEGARALSALTGLTSLDLGGNGIGDEGARALSALTGLTSLDLGATASGPRGPGRCPPSPASPALISGATRIGAEGARALSALTGLISLDLQDSGITDVWPLMPLVNLESINLSRCNIRDACPEFWAKPSLRSVTLDEAQLGDVPPEVLSRESYDNCLDRLRAHFNDLAPGAEIITDVKFMILGNGRIGKTQICRRLRGEPFDPEEEFDPRHPHQRRAAPRPHSSGTRHNSQDLGLRRPGHLPRNACAVPQIPRHLPRRMDGGVRKARRVRAWRPASSATIRWTTGFNTSRKWPGRRARFCSFRTNATG